jgi:hypothetical protein
VLVKPERPRGGRVRAGPRPTASRDEEGEHAEDSRDGRRAEVVEGLSARLSRDQDEEARRQLPHAHLKILQQIAQLLVEIVFGARRSL